MFLAEEDPYPKEPPTGYTAEIALMELISKHGSISSVGREMGMSYRRARLLVDEINRIFREPLVETQLGGGKLTEAATMATFKLRRTVAPFLLVEGHPVQ